MAATAASGSGRDRSGRAKPASPHRVGQAEADERSAAESRLTGGAGSPSGEAAGGRAAGPAEPRHPRRAGERGVLLLDLGLPAARAADALGVLPDAPEQLEPCSAGSATVLVERQPILLRTTGPPGPVSMCLDSRPSERLQAVRPALERTVGNRLSGCRSRLQTAAPGAGSLDQPEHSTEPPSPLQPAARRVGAVLAAPPAAALAGTGRGVRRRRRGRSYDAVLLPLSRATSARTASGTPPTRAPSRSTTTSRPCCRRASVAAVDDGGLLVARARRRPLPRDLLLAAPRPHARRDAGERDPAGRRRVGGGGDDPRLRARDPLRAGLREQGRDDGLQQPASALPGVGDRPRPEPAGRASSRRSAPTSRRHGRDLLGDYLERELAAGERIVCQERALGGARAVLGGVAVRDDAGAACGAWPTCPSSRRRSATRSRTLLAAR